MICPNCAKFINDGDAFCGFCGASTNVNPAPSYMPASGGVAPMYNPVPESPVMSYAPASDSSAAYYDEEATLPMMPPISEIPSTEFCLKCGRVLQRGQVCACEGAASPTVNVPPTPASLPYEREPEMIESTFKDADVYSPAPKAPATPVMTPAPEHVPAAPVLKTTVTPKASTPKAPADPAANAFFKPVNKL